MSADLGKSKIEFRMTSPTYVQIVRNGKVIGRIYSDQGDEHGTPFPHERNTYCLNSIQICGFDRMSEVWACGPFEGKRDCVVHFMPLDDSYYLEARKRYEEYVKKFFETKIRDDNPMKHQWADLNLKSNKEITSLKSFDDWVRTEGI